MHKTARVHVIFALPAGGEHTERLRVPVDVLYAHHAVRVKARAVAAAKRKGVAVGNCLRVMHKTVAVWLYEIDTTARFSR